MAIEETSNFLATPHPNFAQFHCEEFQDHCILQVHFSPVVLVFAQIDGPRLLNSCRESQSSHLGLIQSGLCFGVFSKGQRGKDHLHDFDIGSDQILEVLRHILGQSSPVILVILKGIPWPSWITYVLHRVAHGVKHTRCQMITNFDTMERPMEEPQFVCVCVILSSRKRGMHGLRFVQCFVLQGDTAPFAPFGFV